MPRTKVPRKNAGKGNKNSEGEQAQAQAESIRHLEGLLESWKVEEALINDQCLENFDSMIQGIIRKTPDHILNMTMGEFSKKLEKSMVCKPINRTNQGSSTATSSQLSLDTGKYCCFYMVIQEYFYSNTFFFVLCTFNYLSCINLYILFLSNKFLIAAPPF